MDIVYDILWQSGGILALLLVFVSFGVSALILFKPVLASQLNSKFNHWVCTEQVNDNLDAQIKTTEAILKYRIPVGLVFFFGALYTSYYLLFVFNPGIFIKLVIAPSSKIKVFVEISIDFVKWLLVVWCGVGVVVCSIMIVSPETFKKVNSFLDKFFSTKQVQELIDAPSDSIDQWVLKNHVMVGFFLLMGSCFLIVFCFSTFFK